MKLPNEPGALPFGANISAPIHPIKKLWKLFFSFFFDKGYFIQLGNLINSWDTCHPKLCMSSCDDHFIQRHKSTVVLSWRHYNNTLQVWGTTTLQNFQKNFQWLEVLEGQGIQQQYHLAFLSCQGITTSSFYPQIWIAMYTMHKKIITTDVT